MGISLPRPRRMEHFRDALMREIATTSRYQHAIDQDLRSAWRPVRDRYWMAARVVPLFLVEHEEWEQQSSGEVGRELTEYYQMLLSVVRDRLSLTSHGAPLRWALEVVHSHVEDSKRGPSDPPGLEVFDLRKRMVVTNLKISVSDDEAVAGLFHDDSLIHGAVHSAVSIAAFQDWKDLERTAVELARKQVSHIRSVFEADDMAVGTGSDHLSKVVRDLEHVPLLAQMLTSTPRNRPIPDGKTEKRLRRLCGLIMVDYPGQKLIGKKA